MIYRRPAKGKWKCRSGADFYIPGSCETCRMADREFILI